MTFSSNEIESTCLKAARGAQWPLAQAQECARAVSRFPRSTATFVAALRCTNWGDVQSDGNSLIFQDAHPVIDLMSAMDAVGAGCDECCLLGLELSDLTEALANCRIIKPVDLVQTDNAVTVRASNKRGAKPPHQRFEVPIPIWAELQGFAAKTYVPETEASRSAGAGAGLTDND